MTMLDCRAGGTANMKKLEVVRLRQVALCSRCSSDITVAGSTT